MIYSIGKRDFRCVRGANVDARHPYGDLDRIIMDGNLFPYRQENKEDSDYKQWKKCLRGEDIAYLLERTLRAKSWAKDMVYDFDGSGNVPTSSPYSSEFSRLIGSGTANFAISGMPRDVDQFRKRLNYVEELNVPEDPNEMIIAGEDPLYMFISYINPIDSSSIIPDLIHRNFDTTEALSKAFSFWDRVNYHAFYGECGRPDFDTQVTNSNTVYKNVLFENVIGFYTPATGLGVYHRKERGIPGEPGYQPEEYSYNVNVLNGTFPICSNATTSMTFGIYRLYISCFPSSQYATGTWTIMIPQTNWAIDSAAVSSAVSLATGQPPPTLSDVMGLDYISYQASFSPLAIVAVNNLR